MRNKILVGLFLVIMSFTLVGCGKEAIIDKDEENLKQNTDNDQENNLNINLYSDNTKIVFDFSEVYKIVFYYVDDKITGQEIYYDFGDTAIATVNKVSIEANASEEDGIESVVQKDIYIIVKYEESEYENLTVEEVKQTYAYLEEIQKNN